MAPRSNLKQKAEFSSTDPAGMFETLPEKCVFLDEKRGIWLYHSDCFSFMDSLIEKFPNGIFDMIFSDPPYFLSNGGITCHSGKMVSVDKGQWDKSEDIKINHEFNKRWLSRCQRLLTPDGTIWISGTHHIIYSVGYALQELGFKILNSITWEKPNPPPNLSCRYFTHSTETVIWAARNSKSKHRFNYEKIKNMNKGKQMKSVWTISAPGAEEKQFGKHPTQKPLQLLERIILASTIEGDLIFDPFSGSSTTGVAAIRLGRKFVGCERESQFIELSLKRLKKESTKDPLSVGKNKEK